MNWEMKLYQSLGMVAAVCGDFQRWKRTGAGSSLLADGENHIYAQLYAVYPKPREMYRYL